MNVTATCASLSEHGAFEQRFLALAGAPGSGSFLFADPAAEDAALREAAHSAEHRALTALREHQDGSNGSNGEHGSTNGEH